MQQEAMAKMNDMFGRGILNDNDDNAQKHGQTH